MNRSPVYPLLTAVFILVLGISALLGVSYQRHRRFEDETVDLRRNLNQQTGQMTILRQRLKDCLTNNAAETVAVDTLWAAQPTLRFMRVVQLSTRR